MSSKSKKKGKSKKRPNDGNTAAGGGIRPSTTSSASPSLLDLYHCTARKLGASTDQDPPEWIQALVQQPDPAALHVVLDGGLAQGDMDTLRQFLIEISSCKDSDDIRIRWLMLWGAVRPSPSADAADAALGLFRSWSGCRPLYDHLTRLHLFDCDLGPAAAVALAPFLSRAQALRELKLDHNPALSEPKALPVLVETIAGLSQLARLSLAYCSLPSPSSAVLAPLLESHVCLRELDLEGNCLGDSGAEHLAQAVIRSSPLCELELLNVSNNGLHGDIHMQHMILAASRSRHVLIVIHDVLQYDLLLARSTMTT